jgi:dTDP-4-amino-4,6-dideoxygalactose transaminase
MIRMLRRQLESCDEKWYERRSERAVALLQRIRGHLPTPGAAVPGNTFWAFFVRANDPMALKRLLAKDGFITEANPLIVVGVAHEHESRETQLSYVPNARLLSEYTVDIPFRETFTDRELDALAHGIREAAASFPSLSPYESEVSSRPASDAL